ncbi:hypothetical protein PRIPAC_79364 [Pristionchus pacificus]|uniref:Uncharacterized protein n=1 Tax=Pristionchus pacificus TaxID=54126 RepID=A0A2A6CN38_PRIPA|nr:hypothetical protein PRIPAC_79364 [Pristionchus pacificus]|eukprot:PDM79507.1 hypothetical protein PRIPAC_32086 [Pristionchus pacificus]
MPTRLKWWKKTGGFANRGHTTTATIDAIGFYGIYCVLVFDFDWSWHGPSAIVRRKWKGSSIGAMLAAQLLIPILVCAPFAFEQPTGNGKEFGPNYLTDYPYINDVAVFSSPVLLLVTSSQLRRLIWSYFHRPEFVQISPLATVTRM